MDNPKRDPRRRSALPPNVVPLHAFVEVSRLMRKLGMSPADCLDLLAGALTDLDREIDAYEDALDADVPLWLVGNPHRPDLT